MIKQLGNISTQKSTQVLALIGVITILLSYFLFSVSFNTDVEAFLPDSQITEDHHQVGELFGNESHVIYLHITTSNSDNSNILEMDCLLEILSLQNAVNDISNVDNSISVASYLNKALEWQDSNLTQISELDNPWDAMYNATWQEIEDGSDNVTYGDIEFLADVLIHRDLDWLPLWASEGTERAAPEAESALVVVFINPDLDTDGRKEVGKITRDLVDNELSFNSIQVDTFSTDLMAYDVDKSTRDTNILMALGMLGVTICLLWFSFRQSSYVILPILTLALSIIWTFGLAGLLNIKLTAISVAVLPLVVGLGIDFSVHISRRYMEELNKSKDFLSALLKSQKHIGYALSLAAATTVIAFLSGITAGVGPVRDFSIMCAIGISCSFILTLTFHTAARFIIDSKLSNSKDTIPKSSKIIDTITHFSIHSVKNHPITIVAATVVITLLSIGGATQLETSFTLDDFLSEDLEIMVIGLHVNEDYRGGSYAQSQILIKDEDQNYKELLEGTFTVQCNLGIFDESLGIKSECSNRPSVDYVIQVGAEARVDSVYQIVRTAIHSESSSITYHGDGPYFEISGEFHVYSNESLSIEWISNSDYTINSTIFWIAADKSETNTTLTPSISPHSFSDSHYSVNITPPSNAITGYLKFEVSSHSPVVNSLTVRGEDYYFVQSLRDTFTLSSKGTPISSTTNEDVKNLFDYLYQRDLDIADRFTGESFTTELKKVLHKTQDGEYNASVIRIYIGPTKHNPLDKAGLNQMLSQLSSDIPIDVFSSQMVSLTGGHVLTITTINTIEEAQINSTLISLVMASLFLLLVYRKLSYSILTIIPVVIATFWILGTMSLLGISLNVLTVMVTALTIGLGIDYAIHIVERYRHELKTSDNAKAVEIAIKHTGSALVISGITSLFGFAVLTLSPMPLVRNFGIITAATIIYSVLIAVLVLPSLMLLSGNMLKDKN